MAIAHPMARPLFMKWEPLIQKHAAMSNMEIEIRFGRRSGKGFDTNVGPGVFIKVMSCLERYEGWESKKHTSATVYYFDGSRRLTVDEDTGEQVGHIKKRVLVDDFILDSIPFDVRLGASTEEPFEYDEEEMSTKQTAKERWSFVRKNLSIDMTIIKKTLDDKDSDEDTVHQIEMEIIDLTKISGMDELFNVIHKVFDLLKCIDRPCI